MRKAAQQGCWSDHLPLAAAGQIEQRAVIREASRVSLPLRLPARRLAAARG